MVPSYKFVNKTQPLKWPRDLVKLEVEIDKLHTLEHKGLSVGMGRGNGANVMLQST
jgi:hypothetical protein